MSSREEIKHVFISHSADADKKEAAALSDWIKTAYKNVDVFVSSLNSIECGNDPMRVLVEGLSKADALILLMTPTAMQNEWIIFEAGFVYGKHRKHSRQHNVLPLVCKGAKISQLPKPIHSLMQAKDIAEGEGFEQAISTLDFILKQSHTKSLDPLRKVLSYEPPCAAPFALTRRPYDDRPIM